MSMDMDIAFLASESFDGSRSGYVYKRGASGMGYYRDVGADASQYQVLSGVFAHEGAAVDVSISVPGTGVPQRVFGWSGAIHHLVRQAASYARNTAR